MEHRAQTQVAFADAEGVFSLGQLDVPTPEFGRVLLLTIGAQQIRAVRECSPGGAFGAFDDCEATATAVSVAFHGDFQQAFGRRKASEPAANAPFDRTDVCDG